MRIKHIPLTAVQFEQLNRVQGWEVYEIPRIDWPNLPRLKDSIALMGSADINDPKLLNDIQAVAGLDQLVYESNPKPGEQEGNAYHFVVEQTNDPRCPYLLHGPFKSGTKVKHWFEVQDLDKYWLNGSG